MKKLSLTILISILLHSFSNAQFEVNLSSNLGDDTLKICINDKVTFYSSATLASVPVTGVTYKWDFDDKSTDTGDTVQHTFSQRKGYRVRVIAIYNNDTAYKIIPVEVGLIADFSETKTDIENEEGGICPGEEFTLEGKAANAAWEGEFVTNHVEPFIYQIEFPSIFKAPIDHKEFQYSDILNSGSEIKSIGVKIEHENLSNIQIKIVCPNQAEVILKDFGGEAKYLGEPILDDAGDEGEPYWYYWTNSPEYSTINNESANYDTLPSGNYLSEELFDKLIGCPLNGDWNIMITDNVADDNGFIWEWSLLFEDEILPDTFRYENNYPIAEGTWSGEGVGATNQQTGNCVLESPLIAGGYMYEYIIDDNFGCPSSKVLSVEVERASFTLKKDGTSVEKLKVSSEIGDELAFEDSTSWTTEILWDFGDNTENRTEEKIDPYFYIEEGLYQVLMKATSAKGCVDYDTALIDILSLDSVQMFTDKNFIITPNGDGVNDFFTVFDGDGTYTGGDHIDSLIFSNDFSADKDAANILEFKGRIFNRYGQVVCEWNSVEEALHGWDGTNRNNGNIYVADGTYYYVVIIRLKYEEKKLEPYKGAVYVLKNK